MLNLNMEFDALELAKKQTVMDPWIILACAVIQQLQFHPIVYFIHYDADR